MAPPADPARNETPERQLLCDSGLVTRASGDVAAEIGSPKLLRRHRSMSPDKLHAAAASDSDLVHREDLSQLIGNCVQPAVQELREHIRELSANLEERVDRLSSTLEQRAMQMEVKLAISATDKPNEHRTRMQRLEGEMMEMAAAVERKADRPKVPTATIAHLDQLASHVRRKADAQAVPTMAQHYQLRQAILELTNGVSDESTSTKVHNVLASMQVESVDSPCSPSRSSTFDTCSPSTARRRNLAATPSSPCSPKSIFSEPLAMLKRNSEVTKATYEWTKLTPRRVVKFAAMAILFAVVMLTLGFGLVVQENSTQLEHHSAQMEQITTTTARRSETLDQVISSMAEKPNRDEVATFAQLQQKIDSAEASINTQVRSLVQQMTTSLGGKADRSEVPIASKRDDDLGYSVSYRIPQKQKHDEVIHPTLTWVPVNLSDAGAFDVGGQYRLLSDDYREEQGYIEASLLFSTALFFPAKLG